MSLQFVVTLWLLVLFLLLLDAGSVSGGDTSGQRFVWWRGCVVSRDRTENYARGGCEMSLQFVVTLWLLVLFLLLDTGSVNATRFQELGESFQRSLTIVVDDLVITLLEKLDGREALDLDVLQLIGSGVHLGND